MRYWMTTHWPPRRGERSSESPGVWVVNGKEQVIQRVSRNDRIWLYQSQHGRAILRLNADGTSSAWPCIRGRQGVIALLEVTAPAYAREDQEPETYTDGSSLWWRWYAPTKTVSSAGFVPRPEAARLLGYSERYVFHGFGESQSGLKELDPSVFEAIHRAFVCSHTQNDEAKLLTLARGGSGGVGGEGRVHKELKAAIAADPERVLGETGMTLVRTEFPFPTGDRIDVLLRDRDGRYVAVEIEPDCSELEMCGPLQCMKYRSLLAYTLDRQPSEVRTVLASRSIHNIVARKCRGFDIETKVVAATPGSSQ